MDKYLLVDNYQITENPMNILAEIKSCLTNGKLDFYYNRGSDIQVQCPVHSEGHEHRGSCYLSLISDEVPYLWAHCFTCGASFDFPTFVGKCFDRSADFGKRWLISNFGDAYLEPKYNLSDIVLEKVLPKKTLDDSVLSNFESYHPYMAQRKLSEDVVKKYEVKYDPQTKCIVFPVRNKYGKLSYLTRRSIVGKNFIIDKDSTKEVYLLYDIIKNNDKEVYITESQINALVCNSYGKKAVAMFGAGCPNYQIKDLNNTGVRSYIICFDPDKAGLKGTIKLCDYLSKNKFVSVMILPEGKDVGDLTKEEFDNCKIVSKEEFLKNIPDYYTK